MDDQRKEKFLFSWLHLSDIHFLHGSHYHQADQEMVVQALVREVSRTISNATLMIPRPDAIFVTGDIAFSGADRNTNEYPVADKWLRELAEASNLSPSEIFVVPGNHDVQRSVYSSDDSDVALLVDPLREGKRELEWAITTKKHYTRLASRFSNYLTFASNFAPGCLQKPENAPLFWQWTLSVPSGFTVRLLGLNTALLSQDDADKGKLQLSLRQLQDFPDLDDNSGQLALALCHHPLSWLRDGQTAEGWLRKKVHILLFGHMHDADSATYRSGGGTEIVKIQAGAIHGDQGSNVAPNGFNYAAVVENPDGQVMVRVWPRMWSEKNKDFRDDPDCHPTDRPYAEHLLPIGQTLLHDREWHKEEAHAEKTRNTVVSSVETTLQKQSTKIAVARGEQPSGLLGVFSRKARFVSDSPPVVDVWVGREAEFHAVDHLQSGVIVVTGLGGQGKSAFAAKFLERWRQRNPRAFWDWRDCREQRERFHTQLVSVIEHLTDGQIMGNALVGAETNDLVRLFFDRAGDRRGLVVLDNVDHYVDLSAYKFAFGMAEFVEGALQRKHNFIVMLTCRPRINYPSTRSQEVYLKGLSTEETAELFQQRGVRLPGMDIAAATQRIHDLTDGHPLWLNLIATQIARTPSRCEEIISDLARGEVDDRATAMMRAIWKGLDRRQEMILRSMAEMSGPEDMVWIHGCVKNEIKSSHKFRLDFQRLQMLNLIVETQEEHGQKKFDLHPIVRNFVRREFSPPEREPYLNKLIRVIDAFIGGPGKSITIFTPSPQLEHWILKAELALRKNDFEIAIKTLLDIGGTLVGRGIPGELFRVSENLFEQCEGRHEKLIDFVEFHELNILLGKTYAEYGRRTDARKHIDRYLHLVPAQTAYYVAVCDVRSYVEWMFGNYEEAIFWGSEGVKIKQKTKVDTEFDAAYSLALAQRDSGDVSSALKYFTHGFTVESILKGDEEDLANQAPLLGNIGRCLQFQRQFDQALRCFVKSACLLEQEEDATVIMNRGYAALWIGEVLEEQGHYDKAYLCYRRAEMIWSHRLPLLVNEPQKRAMKVTEHISESGVLRATDIGIERAFKRLLEELDVSCNKSLPSH